MLAPDVLAARNDSPSVSKLMEQTGVAVICSGRPPVAFTRYSSVSHEADHIALEAGSWMAAEK